MILTYDIATQVLAVDTANVGPRGTIIEAHLVTHGQTIPFVDLSFGARVTADGAVIYERVFPLPGQVWRSTDQRVLWAERLTWVPDQAVEVYAWIANGPPGARVERDTTQLFNVPRPLQPYPSWTWGGTAWEASVAYPTDGGSYAWDEDAGAWVAE